MVTDDLRGAHIAWCTSCVELAHSAHCFTLDDDTSSSSESIHSYPRSYSWRVQFDSKCLFFCYVFFMFFSVHFLNPKVFLKFDNPIFMASVRYSVVEESHLEFDGKHGVEIRIFLVSEWRWFSVWIYLKNLRHKWRERILHADQRKKQNQHKDWYWTRESPFLCVRDSEESNQFYSTLKHIEKKTEQFISGEWKKIFRVSSHILFIGLTVSGKYVWQQEEEQKEDFSIAVYSGTIDCLFPRSSGTSGRILLIFYFRIMWSFRAISSNMFISLNVPRRA